MELGDKLFVIWLILGTYLVLNTVLPMKQLPSPLFGGDYYYQQGQVYHYAKGGGFLDSSSLKNAPPSYAPVYAWLVAWGPKLFGWSSFQSMKYFAIVFFVISQLLWYTVLRELLGPNYALVGTLLINFLSWHPIFKYTEFGYAVYLPLAIYAVYRSWKTDQWWLAGIALGLSAYIHGVIMVGLGFVILPLIYNKPKAWVQLLIALLILLPLILSYMELGFEKKFPRYKMDFPDFSRFDVWLWFIGYAINKLISLNTWVLIFLIYKYKLDKQWLLWLLGALIGLFSFILTEPLFNINFFPTYMVQLVFFPVLVIVLLKLSNVSDVRIWILVVLALFILNYHQFQTKIQDKFFQIAYTPLPPEMLSLQTYLSQLPVDTVILTNKELGFAVNAISGLKLVTGRWAHNTNTPYVDMPLRDVETAIILYGKNLSERLRLLKKWNVSYIYFHTSWPKLEFIKYTIPKNKYGAAQTFYDPLFTTNPSHKVLLNAQGVKYFDVITWLDPSVRNPYIKAFPVSVVSWENYEFKGYGIWNSDIDPYLTPVWNYSINGRLIAVLYKVNLGAG